MAKKRRKAAPAAKKCGMCPPWFAILVLLIGLWFMAADLGWLTTGGLALWPVVVALFGIMLWLKKETPPWFAVLVLLVGLWFMAANLGWLTTGGLTLWPIVIALVGLWKWLCK
jgi:hypothetical protein